MIEANFIIKTILKITLTFLAKMTLNMIQGNRIISLISNYISIITVEKVTFMIETMVSN